MAMVILIVVVAALLAIGGSLPGSHDIKVIR
jgi:hypothetical protein